VHGHPLSYVTVDSSAASQAADRLKKAKADNATQRKEEITKVKTTALARIPTHMLYVYSADENALKWHKNDSHKINGIVQTIAAFHSVPDDAAANQANARPFQNAYVSLEFIVKAIKSDPAAQARGLPVDPN
jgi:hypothetical protein